MPRVKERAWARDTHFGVVTVCMPFKTRRLSEITKITRREREIRGLTFTKHL